MEFLLERTAKYTEVAVLMKIGSLTTAVWEITLRCNLRCLHCGSSAGEASEKELTTEEAIELCEDLAKLGCENVCLMGGEPFLRDDWFEIAKAIKDLSMEVSFVSNGIIVDKVLKRLAKTEPIVVGISIDGAEKIHDHIRGRGSYKKAVDSLTLLKSANIKTTVITAVSKMNFKELPKIKDLLLGREIGWQIQIAKPMGRFEKEHHISKKEFYAIGLFIAHCKMKHKFNDLPIIGAHDIGYHPRFFPWHVSWNGCTGGITSVGIASNGDILPCLSLRDKQFVEGNVKERSLVEIWNDENCFCYTRNFDVNNLGNNCRNCEFGKTCKGGCSSMSHYLSGNLHNDPFCFRRML